MTPYFMGGSGNGFGSNGNFFAQIGSLGPAWQNTMLQGLNTQNAFNEFQNKQLTDPYRVNAVAGAYGVQGLQNLYAAQQQMLELNALYRDMQLGNINNAIQQYRNMGINPDTIQYRDNLTATAPLMARPIQPANAGSYAATSPAAESPPQGYAEPYYKDEPLAFGSVLAPSNFGYYA